MRTPEPTDPPPEPDGGADRDPGQIPLSQIPTEALIFTLGFVTARPERAHRHYGGIAAIADELTKRGEYDRLRARLPGNVSAALEAMYRADRGQRMAGAGVNHPKSGK